MLIGHVGVLQPRDARFLFTALDLLRRDWPECRLVVIGRHSCDLRRYREARSGWFDTGEVSYEDLVSYIAASDVLLLPLADSVANRARWPSRVNDYLAAGRPIVTTDVGDVAKLMRESDAGVVTHTEPEGFAAGVSALLQDRELRAACGRRGRAVAETQLAWPIVTKTLEEFYMKLVGE
jgi:glycosyltransferase involved in cell wall biosynthesis